MVDKEEDTDKKDDLEKKDVDKEDKMQLYKEEGKMLTQKTIQKKR